MNQGCFNVFFVLILVNLREMKISEKYVGSYETFVFVLLGSLAGQFGSEVRHIFGSEVRHI